MSKQSEAKKRQSYKHKGKKCWNCAHLTYDLVMPEWMLAENEENLARGWGERYGDDRKQAKNMKCSLGQFAVRKVAVCDEWAERGN